jgi:hypothetical protein
MLGEQMFLQFREQKFDVAELMEWLRYPPHSDDFYEFYYRLLKRMK